MTNYNFLNIVKSKVQVDYQEQMLIGGKSVTFLNPYSYWLLRKQKHVLSSIDHVLIDGIVLVQFLKLVGLKCQRNSFDMTSVAPKVFAEASAKKLRTFLLGSKQEEIEKAVDRIKTLYPNLEISGYRNGYLKESEKHELASILIEQNIDLIVIGMGTPHQENLIKALRELNFKGSAFTCGGFFHQTARTEIGKADYYPPIFDKLHLRWLYRIIDEPKLFSRYFVDYAKFVLVFIWDIINLKNGKRTTGN